MCNGLVLVLGIPTKSPCSENYTLSGIKSYDLAVDKFDRSQSTIAMACGLDPCDGECDRMNSRSWSLIVVVIISSIPSTAYASDFGGLAVVGLIILAIALAVSLSLAAVTAFFLNRHLKTRVSWWWLLPVFTAIWFYVVFQILRFLR